MSFNIIRKPIAQLEQKCKIEQTTSNYSELWLDRIASGVLALGGIGLIALKGGESNNITTGLLGGVTYLVSQVACTYGEKKVDTMEEGLLKNGVSGALKTIDFLNNHLLSASLQTMAPTGENIKASSFLTAINNATFFSALPNMMKTVEADLKAYFSDGNYKYTGLKAFQDFTAMGVAIYVSDMSKDALELVLPEKAYESIYPTYKLEAKGANGLNKTETPTTFLGGVIEAGSYAWVETLSKAFLTNQPLVKGFMQKEMFGAFVDQGVRSLVTSQFGPFDQKLLANFYKFAAIDLMKKGCDWLHEDLSIDSCNLDEIYPLEAIAV